MKKLFLFAALSIALVTALAAAAAAQKVGGYKDVAVNDATVLDAARFAAAAQGDKMGRSVKLLKINSAEVQVVAGRNYKLCVKVQSSGREDEADAIFTATTIVFIDLKGNKKLTSFEPSDCAEDEDDDDDGQ